ncbi:hypothetical protein O3P69_002861 [Scylla paramamosain]|uniref:Uncharacterized protein n=1 Tax=Scylla paramamosain TaxID=85552 RepID=A0AAW0UMM5_SCYPA
MLGKAYIKCTLRIHHHLCGVWAGTPEHPHLPPSTTHEEHQTKATQSGHAAARERETDRDLLCSAGGIACLSR